ncbi:MAG: glycosyltransferase [Candidatus Rokubacteria bacterium]|nr:glycosyltransferase [Candidatus Rokubacteria bacterium]
MSQANPLVSVVTVVRNGAPYIEETLRSVISQTYPRIEYIVIDGGSTDGTVEIIKRYEDRIARWVSEPDGGIYDAINKGIRIATGDLIGVVHGDDYYCPDAVDAVVQAARARPETGIFYGYLDMVSALDGRVVFTKKTTAEEILPPKLDMIGHPTWFVRADVHRRHGLYDPRFRIGADRDFILRALLGGEKAHQLPRTIAYFRLGGVSGGTSLTSIAYHKRQLYGILRNNRIPIRYTARTMAAQIARGIFRFVAYEAGLLARRARDRRRVT